MSQAYSDPKRASLGRGPLMTWATHYHYQHPALGRLSGVLIRRHKATAAECQTYVDATNNYRPGMVRVELDRHETLDAFQASFADTSTDEERA